MTNTLGKEFLWDKILQYKLILRFTKNIREGVKQAVTIPVNVATLHCGQEICIESQEIFVNIHAFVIVASGLSRIKWKKLLILAGKEFLWQDFFLLLTSIFLVIKSNFFWQEFISFDKTLFLQTCTYFLWEEINLCWKKSLIYIKEIISCGMKWFPVAGSRK